MEESYKYYKVVMELQNLAVALETKPFSFKSLVTFKDKPLSKTVVNRLRSELLEKITEKS